MMKQLTEIVFEPIPAGRTLTSNFAFSENSIDSNPKVGCIASAD